MEKENKKLKSQIASITVQKQNLGDFLEQQKQLIQKAADGQVQQLQQ